MSLSGRETHAIFSLALLVGYRNNIINGDQKSKEMAFLIWYTSTGLRNVLNNKTENVHTYACTCTNQGHTNHISQGNITV